MLYSYNVETQELLRLIDPELLKNALGKPVSMEGRSWSRDETKLLFSDRPNKRGESQGNLYLFTLADRELRVLTDTDLPQRNAKLSPNSNKVGFVRADDLWVIDLVSGREKRLTRSAASNRYKGNYIGEQATYASQIL